MKDYICAFVGVLLKYTYSVIYEFVSCRTYDPILLLNVYRKLIPDGPFTGNVKPTSHIHPVPRLRTDGTTPPFVHMPSWCLQGKV